MTRYTRMNLSVDSKRIFVLENFPTIWAICKFYDLCARRKTSHKVYLAKTNPRDVSSVPNNPNIIKDCFIYIISYVCSNVSSQQIIYHTCKSAQMIGYALFSGDSLDDLLFYKPQDKSCTLGQFHLLNNNSLSCQFRQLDPQLRLT